MGKLYYILVFGLLMVFASPVFAGSCVETNNQCVTDCCNRCGGETWTDDAGALFCQGPEGSRQSCIDACLQCGHDYQQCLDSGGNASMPGGSYPSGSSGSSSSCCGSAVILGAILGLAVLRRS
jgi:hypothetical protein